MAQVPGCGCDTGSSGGGGGGTCASVVVQRMCADDGSDRPVLVRTVVLCNGTLVTDTVLPDGTAYAGAVKECDVQCCDGGAGGGGGDHDPHRLVALGHGELTLDNITAQGLPAAPGGADMVLIENPPRGSQMLRWRDDGTSPAAGTGDAAHYLNRGVWIEYRGQFDAIEFIADSAAGARLIYTFYAAV